VRYRINDQLTIRGTTSFEEFRERSGVLLEYETRF
jgi:translocation and assembly module TamB